MAMNPYTGQDDDGYLSTDPHAGQDGTDFGYLPPPSGPWTGGVTGKGEDPFAGNPSETPRAIPPGGDPTGIHQVGGLTGANGQATAGGSAYAGDQTNVDAWLAWLATQPGHDPILDTPQGQAYYKQRITETGGLSASNQAYWQNKGTLAANGGAVGAPEGGGTGSLWNKMPTLADIQGIPGYQEALAEGKRSYETGAASHGTLLNARTVAGEGAAVSNQVLSQFYFPFAQQQYQNNQGNAQNLYNLAQLGYQSGSSV